MKKRAVVVVVALLTTASPARAAREHGASQDVGIRLGARVGLAIPMGDAAEGATMSDALSATLPLGLDAAYRFSPNIEAGLYFKYAFGFPKNCPAGVSCSARTIHLGAEAFYHFLPTESFDPYLGLGTGWEWASLSMSAGGQSQDQGFNGWEFLTFHAGGDFRLAQGWSVGPYLAFSLAQYSNCSFSQNGQDETCRIVNSAMHEWFQFGVRGTFDF